MAATARGAGRGRNAAASGGGGGGGGGGGPNGVLSGLRTLLLVLAFLDTVCTRVGISQGHNQGEKERMQN